MRVVPFTRLLACARLVSLAAAVCTALPSFAGQTLIPSPYPSNLGGGQPLNPDPAETRSPQQLRPDPYPQILGENAQGNPPIYKKHRHQRLVPSIYQRKYRVDRR